MPGDIAEIARKLAECADAVCRRYLPAGRREAHQWRVGDVHNAPGRSLFVRLTGPASGRGAAGRWRDAATGEHGDLIDLIQKTCGLPTAAQALNEARRFLGAPANGRGGHSSGPGVSTKTYDPMVGVARLLAHSRPISGALAEDYLRRRAIDLNADLTALRFHPNCPYRDPVTSQFSRRPAMLAIVTDLDGVPTGLQRTYLSSGGDSKADVAAPRRSLGCVRGHGVRFGAITDVALLGEGVETVLSLKQVLPTMPMVATLSADNLGVCTFPPTLRRLYIAVDRDPAGFAGAEALLARARRAGIRAVRLLPIHDDFNADLTERGPHAIRRSLASKLLAEDLGRLDDS